MGLFELLNPFSSTAGLDPETEALMEHASKLFTRHQIGEKAVGWLSGDQDLDREGKRLDIAMKRRQLGYPDTSQEYEDSTNSGRPAWLTALGGGAQRVPEPHFMEPPSESVSFAAKYGTGHMFEQNAVDALGKEKWAFLSNGLNAFGDADKVKPNSALKGIKNAFSFLRLRP